MIDLFYRVYEICAEFGFEKPIIFYAIILTCCSVIDIETYAEHYAARGDVIPEDVAVCQIILVNICSGHFTRPCLADFITKPKKQKKAFAWLQENPRAYYNFSLSELVSKLN